MEIKNKPNIDVLKKNDKLIFGYIGRFHEGKGIVLLINAYESFLKNNSGHKLVLKGDGQLLDKIKKIIDDKSLNDFVTILPPQIDIDEIFREIDILIFPTDIQEGMGLILIEAMVHNITIIKSHFINDDDAFNNDTCFLFKPGDKEELLKVMKEAVDNNEKRERLLINASQIVKERFVLKRFIDEYLNLLQEL